MIVVLASHADDEAARRVQARMTELGLGAHLLQAGTRRLIHVTSGPTKRARRLLALEEVLALVPTSGPRVRLEGRRFYPYHTLRMGAVLLALLGLLVLLSGMRPPPLAAAASAPLIATAWPWYLAPLRGLLHLAPAEPPWLGPCLALVLLALILALPLFERGRGSRAGTRGPALVTGLVLGALLLALGCWEGAWWEGAR